MKNKKKVGVYGLLGSYTDQAAKKILKKNEILLKDIDFIEKPDAKSLMDFMNKGNLVVLPIENSTAGTVTQFLDLFPKYDFEIISEYFLPINHCLLAKKNVKKTNIKKVYSHPQSLMQCSDFLKKNNYTAISDSDNSVAAKNVSEMNEDNVASIGGEILSEIYDLKILDKKIQNQKDNTTRFFAIKKLGHNDLIEKKVTEKNKKKTSIVFEIKNNPGALYKCLGAFATYGINLTKIESRPLVGKNFNYFFLVEFSNNLDNNNTKKALNELEFFAQKVKILGSY